MTILIITPAPTHSRKGNRVTAVRWARILRGLGYQVRIQQEYRGERCDVMVALHARRSHPSIKRCRDAHPDLPLILALTGTDLYGDIRNDISAQESLELASAFIVLQPMGIQELPPKLRHKAHVIYQSVRRPPGIFGPKCDVFEVCVLGHLRPVKDPLRTAQAVRLLPASSRIQVVHIGQALSKEMQRQAEAEQTSNRRYQWLDELPRWKAIRILARTRLLVLTSEMEGGANAVSEALVCSVPVISSRISGSIGMLGHDYPGYFPTGDTQALANLLLKAEHDEGFYATLKVCCDHLKHLFTPEKERDTWKNLLKDL